MNCGDATIDGLLAAGTAVAALGPGGPACAVGHLNDLLRGQGYSYLPDPRLAYYGIYGSVTRRAVSDYRARNGIGFGETADGALLRDMVARPATKAAVCPAYVPLVLDVEFTSVHRFVWLTSLFETGGLFQKLNLNTDGCGVSFGILQWSQKPGQLYRLLKACHDSEPDEWIRILGGDAILDYTGKANGGLDKRGVAIDRAFELTLDPWKSRLEALGASLPMRRVQLDMAAATYRAQLNAVTSWAQANSSERMLAFLLDLSNQFGPGRVKQRYQDAARQGTSEAVILQTLEDGFTALANTQFRSQVRARREFFRTTPLLSDEPPKNI